MKVKNLVIQLRLSSILKLGSHRCDMRRNANPAYGSLDSRKRLCSPDEIQFGVIAIDLGYGDQLNDCR